MNTTSTGGGYGHNPQNSQIGQPNNPTTTGKEFTHKDILRVKILIEYCLQEYMNKDEVVETLFLNSNLIHPAFMAHGVISLNVTVETILQRLEEQNPDFFRGYYMRMKLKKQIMLFNQLLENQHCMMNVHLPDAPMQNGMPVNNLPMGEEHSIPAAGQPHLVSNCHVVNGVPAPSNLYPIRMNAENVMMMNYNAPHMAPGIPPSNAMPSLSEMPVIPASGGHFSVIGSAFDASAGLQPAPDNATAIPESLDDFDRWMESLDQYALGDDFLNLYPEGS